MSHTWVHAAVPPKEWYLMLVKYGVGGGKSTQDKTKMLVKQIMVHKRIQAEVADSAGVGEVEGEDLADLLEILNNDSEEEGDQKETLDQVLEKLKIQRLRFNRVIKGFIGESTYP